MGRDRFLTFGEDDAVASLDTIEAAVTAWARDLRDVERITRAEHGERLFVELRGTFTKYGETRNRWIEIVRIAREPGEPPLECRQHLDVITRDMDRDTENVADRLVVLLHRTYGGRLAFDALPEGG